MKENGSKEAAARPSELTDARIAELSDWRGETLARVRALIRQADPEMVEEVKWRKPSNAMSGVPVWEDAGIVRTGETYKDKVKLTFASGAALDDPSGLFNASLEGNTRRAIDIHEGDRIDEEALKALIRAAVALNISRSNSSLHLPTLMGPGQPLRGFRDGAARVMPTRIFVLRGFWRSLATGLCPHHPGSAAGAVRDPAQP